MAYEARQIADTIITLSRERGDLFITNLKLQKLLYYTQAWHLALTGAPFFGEPIEAWIHGPVVPSEFRRFREFRWNPIDTAGTPCTEERACQHIAAVLDVYGGFSATQLERLTHSEDPWKNARCGLDLDTPSRNVISQTSMREYYRARLETSQNA